eukprot:354068-Chlamydomonas_euryale.AAC.1
MLRIPLVIPNLHTRASPTAAAPGQRRHDPRRRRQPVTQRHRGACQGDLFAVWRTQGAAASLPAVTVIVVALGSQDPTICTSLPPNLSQFQVPSSSTHRATPPSLLLPRVPTTVPLHIVPEALHDVWCTCTGADPPQLVELAVDKAVNLPRGFAYLEYVQRSDAQKAIDYMNGAQIDGKLARVNFILLPKRRPSPPPP